MSKRVIFLVLAAFAIGLYVLFSIATRAPEPPAHQVFINGNVLTIDANNSVAEAISVRADRIEKVGTSEEILALVDESTYVVDLRGRTLMPGFVDSHGHFPGSGQTVFSTDLNSPPIGDVDDIEEVIDRLKKMADARPDGWIMGWGYDDTMIAEQRHLTREDLDRVSTTRPVSVMHISGHLSSVNSVALAEAGIDENTPDPEGGHIQRDMDSPDQRRPNGVLEETAAREILTRMFDLSLSDGVRMATDAARTYLAQGVTAASAGGMPLAAAKGLGPLSQFNVYPQRVALFPLYEEVMDQIVNEGWHPREFEAGRVTVPRVKIIADGSIQGFTGYLREPYYVAYKGDVNYRGYPSVPRDALFEQVEDLYERRIQVAIHCNGDASIDDGLDAIEAAAAKFPWPQARPLIIHAQMTRRDQIDRMAALGVTPSFFSAHTYFWGDRHAAIFMGPERAANMSPAKWALDAGVRFSSHMDTPVLPMLPLQAVWSQVERKSTSGEVIGPHQRISRVQALRAVTIDAAWQVFMDEEIGSIEPGKMADLVVLSGSPLDAEDMRTLIVERTFIGGAEVYSRL